MIDLKTQEGLRLKELLDARLLELRGRLEGDLPERETQRVRGAIDEIKRLLSEPAPQYQIGNYSNPARRPPNVYRAS